MKFLKNMALALGLLVAPGITFAQANGVVQTSVRVVSPYQNLYYGAAVLGVVLVVVVVYCVFLRKK